jgi:hypothetical protein
MLHIDQYCFSPGDHLIKNYNCIKYMLHISVWLRKIILLQCIYVLPEDVKGKVLPVRAMEVYNRERRGIVASILNLEGEYATLGPGHCISQGAWYPLNKRQGGS